MKRENFMKLVAAGVITPALSSACNSSNPPDQANSKASIETASTQNSLRDIELPANVFASVAELKTSDVHNSQSIEYVTVLGYYEPGDGGGGEFYWDADESKQDHNGGSVIDPDHSKTPSSANANWFDPENTGTGCWKMQNVTKVSALQFGAKGDYEDGEGTDDTFALQALISNHNVVDFHDKSCLISDTLYTKNVTIHSDNAKLHVSESYIGPAIRTGIGTLNDVIVEAQGTYYDLDQDAERGTNRLISSGLVSNIEKGDLLQIKSDEIRYNSYVEEMQTVLQVDPENNTIDLSGGLNYSYKTSDNAKVFKITPNIFNTVGTLEVIHHPTLAEDENLGIEMIYTLNSKVDLKLINCQKRALNVSSCYAPDVKIFSVNAGRSESGDGYGLDLFGPVMNGNFEGLIVAGRHCVAMGSALGYNGIPWNNKFEITGYGSGFSSVFDAHKETGSVYFENCIAIGGDKIYNQSGDINSVNGYVSSAIETYINNCTYYGTGIAFADRAGDIDIFSVDGFTATRAGDLMNLEGPDIKQLILRNIYAQSGRGFIFDDGTIQNITLSNITSICEGNVFMDVSDRMVMPNIIKFDGCNFSSTSSSTMFDIDLPDLSFVLNNCLFENVGDIFLLRKSTDRIEINNSNLENVEVIILMGNSVNGTINKISLQGGTYDTKADELCYIGPNSSVGTFIVNGISASENVVKLMTSQGEITDSVVMGANDMPNVKTIFSGSYTEILSGGESLPLVTRGEGTPKGNIVAPVGCLYLDKTGGAGSTLYIKEKGDGTAEGWVAK